MHLASVIIIEVAMSMTPIASWEIEVSLGKQEMFVHGLFVHHSVLLDRSDFHYSAVRDCFGNFDRRGCLQRLL